MRPGGKEANSRRIQKPVSMVDYWSLLKLCHSGIRGEHSPELFHFRANTFISQLCLSQATLLRGGVERR